MELQVRDARVTDVDRITSLLDEVSQQAGQTRETGSVADLLRQLVYLPNATILVCLNGRLVVGAAVLALRPSVRHGGLVGTVDLLVADPALADDGVIEALLAEILRSARNKGCVRVEAEQDPDASDPARLAGWGFVEAPARLCLDLAVEAGRR